MQKYIVALFVSLSMPALAFASFEASEAHKTAVEKNKKQIDRRYLDYAK